MMMMNALNLAQHQLPLGASASLGVNVSGLSLSPLYDTDNFRGNKPKDTKLDGSNNSINSGTTPSLWLSELARTLPAVAENSSHSLEKLSGVKRLKEPKKDSSVIIKISLLLVVTAFVLIASYKFVVHLFVGYSDRKDDPYTDGESDEEDSTGMKKHHGPILDIG
ncbi:hypothetical protein RRG08_030331 [Elysia crispata]|uniref:Uncharacterized protein n=1 Tax=Elysia crispata TaxID=231223 RepID=A0AAE1CZD4_9GAST|nr:hypothetical protein RRG08_030331 [Elysia crispata]